MIAGHLMWFTNGCIEMSEIRWAVRQRADFSGWPLYECSRKKDAKNEIPIASTVCSTKIKAFKYCWLDPNLF